MHRADNYSLRSYGAMIADAHRAQPWGNALQKAVKPGSVVLEIGTGAGYFAFLAVQFGAARVYAVEPDNSIEVARLCARDVPGSERITWIQGLSTAIDLPEKVDIVIGDLHGMFPFYNSNIESLVDARRRHLRDGGVLIPMRDTLRMVPAQAPHEYACAEVPWVRDPRGMNLSKGRGFVVNEIWRARAQPARREDLLSTPATWGVVDYRTVEDSNVNGDLEWDIERAGVMHGYYAWFDGELAEGIGFSNAPDLPELVYSRGFFPLEDPVDVVPGDRVRTRMSARQVNGDMIQRWDTRITDQAGASKASFRQSSFRSKPINIKDLRRTKPDHAPRLNLDGRIAQAVIEGMAQSQSLDQIAKTLAANFPERFKDSFRALSHAARLSLKYSDSA